MYKLSDYLHQKASINQIPISGGFELSPVCNFSCKMCYVRRSHAQIAADGKKVIPWHQWLSLAEQCKDAGMLYLLLTGGEPFLYPNFRKLYSELAAMGFVLSINTNGTLVDEDNVNWLKTMAPSRINITLYGASPETYQRICGDANGFHRAVRAIQLLKEAEIPIVINGSLIPENADDLKEILSFGKMQGLNTRVSTYMFPPVRRGREISDSRFTAEQAAYYYLMKIRYSLDEPASYLEYLDRINTAEPEVGDARLTTGDEHMQCRAGRSSFWVNWAGRMSACGLFSFPMDYDPFKQPFIDCWTDLTNRVREATVLKECAGCTKRKYCKPCAAMLFAETGDVNKKSKYLCDLTDSILDLAKEYARECI